VPGEEPGTARAAVA